MSPKIIIRLWNIVVYPGYRPGGGEGANYILLLNGEA